MLQTHRHVQQWESRIGKPIPGCLGERQGCRLLGLGTASSNYTPHPQDWIFSRKEHDFSQQRHFSWLSRISQCMCLLSRNYGKKKCQGAENPPVGSLQQLMAAGPYLPQEMPLRCHSPAVPLKAEGCWAETSHPTPTHTLSVRQ